MVADELLRNRVAVLIPDKRGSDSSGGSWQESNFDDLASDAISAIAVLRRQPGVDSSKVGVIGLSQGGWIAPIVAFRSPSVAFVINLVGAAVTVAEQSFTEMANTARDAGLTDAEVASVLRLNQATGAFAMGGSWSAYAALRDSLLSGRTRAIASGFPASADAPIWTFLRGVATFDPVPYWLQVRVPTLVVYGEEDERDNVPVAESVRRLEHAFASVGKRNHRIVVLPGTGHSLLDASRTRFVAPFTRELADWVRTSVLNRSGH